MFDIDYFRKNPDPFYVLAKELYPGNYSPTISHVFIALLAKKGLLRMLFTQNIDCLEREAGVPGERIIEAHGSFAIQRCIDCKKEFPDDLMKEHVFQGVVPRCKDKKCSGLVKPDIVFFGEQLPPAFFQNRDVPALADLILIMGTSLTVQPFASLPDLAKDETPRVLFNMERVGTLGTRADDVVVLGDCDSSVRKLADELGWRDELEDMWRRVVGDKEAERQLRSVQERQAALEDDVGDLADRVGAGLHLNDDDVGSAVGRDGGDDHRGEEPAPEDLPARPPAGEDGRPSGFLDEVQAGKELRETTTEVKNLPVVEDRPSDDLAGISGGRGASSTESTNDSHDEKTTSPPRQSRDSTQIPVPDRESMEQNFSVKDDSAPKLEASREEAPKTLPAADVNKDTATDQQGSKDEAIKVSHETPNKSAL